MICDLVTCCLLALRPILARGTGSESTMPADQTLTLPCRLWELASQPGRRRLTQRPPVSDIATPRRDVCLSGCPIDHWGSLAECWLGILHCHEIQSLDSYCICPSPRGCVRMCSSLFRNEMWLLNAPLLSSRLPLCLCSVRFCLVSCAVLRMPGAC